MKVSSFLKVLLGWCFLYVSWYDMRPHIIWYNNNTIEWEDSTRTISESNHITWRDNKSAARPAGGPGNRLEGIRPNISRQVSLSCPSSAPISSGICHHAMVLCQVNPYHGTPWLDHIISYEIDKIDVVLLPKLRFFCESVVFLQCFSGLMFSLCFLNV